MNIGSPLRQRGSTSSPGKATTCSSRPALASGSSITDDEFAAAGAKIASSQRTCGRTRS